MKIERRAMNTAEVLALIDDERARLDAALAGIPRERLETPGTDGGWSAKDVLAHITWSERELVGVLRQRALVGSELWDLSQDDRNAAVYEQSRTRTLDDVLDEVRRNFAELRAEIARLSDAEMNNPTAIADMPGGLTPWQLLAGGTWRHYAEHLPALQALAGQPE